MVRPTDGQTRVWFLSSACDVMMLLYFYEVS